jgi:hypothetical protein
MRERPAFAAMQKETQMNRFPVIGVVLCAVAASCAGVSKETGEPTVAVLDGNGVRPLWSIDSGGALTFLNADGNVHQIYSPDCPELDSVPLKPGQTFRSVLGFGPKVCHFQDLLAPAKAAYAGTVEVRATGREFMGDSAS